MNIHEHQAKEILKKYGAVVPDGVFSHSVEELLEKAKLLKSEKLVLKAQIHAGGRGKAGGIKIIKNGKVCFKSTDSRWWTWKGRRDKNFKYNRRVKFSS